MNNLEHWTTDVGNMIEGWIYKYRQAIEDDHDVDVAAFNILGEGGDAERFLEILNK